MIFTSSLITSSSIHTACHIHLILMMYKELLNVCLADLAIKTNMWDNSRCHTGGELDINLTVRNVYH